MAYIAHQVYPSRLTISNTAILKRISSSWTKLDEDFYVVHHPEALHSICPVCKMGKSDESK